MIGRQGEWNALDELRRRLLGEGPLSLDEAQQAFEQVQAEPLSAEQVSRLLRRTRQERRRNRKLIVENLESRRLLTVISLLWPVDVWIPEPIQQCESREQSPSVDIYAKGPATAQAASVARLSSVEELRCTSLELLSDFGAAIEEVVSELAERDVVRQWFSVANEAERNFDSELDSFAIA